MDTNNATLEITVRGHWVNEWFMRLFGTPIVVLDGGRHEGSWGRPCRLITDPGTHVVAAGVRYRGTTTPLGTAPTEIAVSPGEVATLQAHNGFLNSTPFRISRPTTP